MHVFYVSLPWIIDPEEYNCSSRSYTEWLSRGSVNLFQGTYYGISGIIFAVLYGLCLVGMARGHLLKIACYRLMFFNGIVDILEIFVGSFLSTYFHFTGAVFCSAMTIDWIAGHLCWSIWCGATFNCVVLAFNRVAEMIPIMQPFRFLFRGKLTFAWMFLSVLFMVARAFTTRPIPYNTVVSSYVIIPAISDDIDWEFSYFGSLFLPIHNISVLVTLVTLYSILCYRVVKIRRISKGGIDKTQIQLFVQSLLICSTTAFTTVVYTYLELFAVPRGVVIMANVVWQLSHGVHGAIYLCFNSLIRKEVTALFIKSPSTTTQVTTTVASTVTKVD